MGTIVPRAELARVSRVRLYNRILPVGAACDDTEEGFKNYIELGRLVHTEAMLAYTQCEVAGPLAGVPWLHVITRLKDEHGMKPEMVNMLSQAVSEYLTNLMQQKVKEKVGA